MTLSDGLLFVSAIVVIAVLLYKIFTFFEFKNYSFWENIFREGAFLVTVLVFGLLGRSIILLDVSNMVAITVLQVLEVVVSLTVIVQMSILYFSLKTLLKRDNPAQREE